MNPIQYDYPRYLEVIALSAERAKAFSQRTDEPVDLGPAPGRPGNRTWGFPITKKTFIQTT